MFHAPVDIIFIVFCLLFVRKLSFFPETKSDKVKSDSPALFHTRKERRTFANK